MPRSPPALVRARRGDAAPAAKSPAAHAAPSRPTPVAPAAPPPWTPSKPASRELRESRGARSRELELRLDSARPHGAPAHARLKPAKGGAEPQPHRTPTRMWPHQNRAHEQPERQNAPNHAPRRINIPLKNRHGEKGVQTPLCPNARRPSTDVADFLPVLPGTSCGPPFHAPGARIVDFHASSVVKILPGHDVPPPPDLPSG